MEEQLISFETAKLAKEKGFDLEVRDSYWERGNDVIEERNNHANVNMLDSHYSAPTQSLLQKWLREEHKIHLVSAMTFGDQYSFMVYKGNNPQPSHITDDGSYEETLEEGLKQSLKLIK